MIVDNAEISTPRSKNMDKQKQQREYEKALLDLEKNLENERQRYTERLSKLLKSLLRANANHAGVFIRSELMEVLPPPVAAKDKKAVEIPEPPKNVFNAASFGIKDQYGRFLTLEVPKQKHADDQLQLELLKQFRMGNQWFVLAFHDATYKFNIYEPRGAISKDFSSAVGIKVDDRVVFVCFSGQLDLSKLELTAQRVQQHAQAVFSSGDVPIELQAQLRQNSFEPEVDLLYNELYQPSDQEVETVKQEKIVVVTKENFEILKIERPNVKKLAPNQQQFLAYIAEQLQTYPSTIENLAQFKVTKDDFDQSIKQDFYDDFPEFWFVDFMGATTDEETRQFVAELSLTNQPDQRDKWLESQKVLLSSARSVLELVTKRCDKTPVSLELELVKYFMEKIILYRQNGDLLPKYCKKDPNYFRKLRQRQEHENRLLFQIDQQPDKWQEKPEKKSDLLANKKLQCHPRDVLAPFIDFTATSESLAKAFKLVLDLAEIQTVIVFGATADGITDFWNKVCIGQDWANVDVFRCCYLQDLRYFNVDDDVLGETHAMRQHELEKYPKCQTLKLSYFTMMRTLISDTNLEQAQELIVNNAVTCLKQKKQCTDQICFTCIPHERKKIFVNFFQIDDAVSRELGVNMRCDSWEVVQGSETGACLVVRFYFENL